MNVRRSATHALPFLLGAILCGPGSAQEQSGPPGSIRFERQGHDFGEIRADEKVSWRWEFSNEGKGPLRILGTKPTCGCTASLLESDEVPPGGSGVLEISFDPRGQEGSVRKSIAVRTDDPERRKILLTIQATVLADDRPPVADGHPPVLGQSLLMGSCAACHAAPAAGKSGEGLYTAVCAQCHGGEGEGLLAPSLRTPDYLAAHDDGELADAIAYGTANPRMPGYSDLMGGPLDDDQIRSLVELIRRWGPLEPAASH